MVVRTPVRVVVDLRGLADRPLDALRVWLVGDLVNRVDQAGAGGSGGLHVVADFGISEGLLVAARRLGVGVGTAPFIGLMRSLEGACRPYRTVQPAGSRQAPEAARPCIPVGAVVAHVEVGTDPLDSSLLHDRDPLAVRLALLRVPPPVCVVLSKARLNRADETLQRWRFKVAGWERFRARPPSRHEVPPGLASLISGCDMAATLTWLHRLEADPRRGSTEKYAAFTEADRVLALDLSLLVGRLRR